MAKKKEHDFAVNAFRVVQEATEPKQEKPLPTQDGKNPNASGGFICKRCGKCCIQCPCQIAQLLYGLTEENKLPCPDLVKVDNKYRCELIANWTDRKHLPMIDGQCELEKI